MTPSGQARVFAAVDLGASSGRVIAGVVDGERVTLHTVSRFDNGVRDRGGHLRWDVTALFDGVVGGLARLAAEHPQVESIGIDTWGVDYGLLDANGELLGAPIAYRDDRTGAVVDAVHARVPRDELYRRTGVQLLPFNTIYQLAAEQRGDAWAKAAHVVLLPDLLAYWLTGALRTEATNASTTGLVDVQTGDWCRELLDRVGIPRSMLAPIEQPGCVRGAVRPELGRRLGLPETTVVTTVASHDTASAVAGVPATSDRFAYVSSGTWSLVGVELTAPVVTPAAQRANFTNERGVDGRIRFLRNVGGLWLLEESRRAWRDDDLGSLLAAASALADDGARVDVDHPDLVAPGDLPSRLVALADGLEASASPPRVVRCVVDSLADAYARTVDSAAALTGRTVDVVHVVGGGSQNELLCRRTAAASGRLVVAGPVEATALGNVLVQARAHGALRGSLDELRAAVARHADLRRYEPDGPTAHRDGSRDRIAP